MWGPRLLPFAHNPSASARKAARRPEPERMHYVDMKTIYGGGPDYRSARARDEQSGAVQERAYRVHGEYTSHARKLDREHHPDYGAPGPVEQRLSMLTPIRGMVVGQYTEASPDLSTLLTAAAEAHAARVWKRAGARCSRDVKAYMITRIRRRFSIFAGRELARVRLARVPYIGASRAAIAARPPRDALAQRAVGAAAAFDPTMFFAWQSQALGDGT